ncbi:amidohydrolase family protein [Alkaliphilus transvaalensis]|uniref:amidohydrolase family protein n=1 Tax=Alkaliphilus transvaalensis TaxID=114628 RepID=UPI0005557C4F|nr:amidohydrolase [Alkaliphilus transvaalensis]
MLDILIHNATVVTMEGKGVGIIEDGAVGIKNNKIEVVGLTTEIKKKYSAHQYIDATRKVVMPGLIDAHIHTGISILRGLSQDIGNWMQKGLWPFYKGLTPQESRIGSLVNIIEGVKAGTTTFCDYDHPMGELVKNHVEIGTRARISDMINELPPNMADIAVGDIYPLDSAIGNEKLMENIKLINEWHLKENGRITCLLGPQGPDMVSKELLLEIKYLAEKYDTNIHMHVAQGDREINQMIKRYGKRSIQYLDEIGYLDHRLMAVHLTEATKEETQLLAKRGASMILCSGSIGIIDGMVPPMAEFLEVSSRAALGSDQAPGNNCNNMFNEMKFTAILNKCKAKNPEVFPAWKVLRLATIDGAKAIGLGDEIGSIKEGKKADLIIINFDKPNLSPIILSPIRNIVPNLVYAANGNEVETVIIDGKIIMEEGKLLTVDENKAVLELHKAAERVANRAVEDVKRLEIPLLQMMKEGYL